MTLSSIALAFVLILLASSVGLSLLLLLRRPRMDLDDRALRDELARLEQHLREDLASQRRDTQENSRAQREELSRTVQELGRTLGESLASLGVTQQANLADFSGQLGRLRETMTQDAAQQRQELTARLDQLREGVAEQLEKVRQQNEAKLEQMRLTVDEKLHETLERRLGESFKQVSERLEQVQRGLGEMQGLAAGVGDLKKVLTNVKARGTWGEVQLGNLLEQMLTTEQFVRQYKPRPRSPEVVEFAVRLPGREEGDEPVFLPIDAKFPKEDYERLVDASERGDITGVETAVRQLETRIRQEARAIRDKYIAPPQTTDFAILYLPTEGLYAEVLRRPGLADGLQRDHRVMVAGPTTLAALLNSLQMGFKTLAIQKRSSEVWRMLSVVKTKFESFGALLEKAERKIEDAGKELAKVRNDTRIMGDKLRKVEALPEADQPLELELPPDAE